MDENEILKQFVMPIEDKMQGIIKVVGVVSRCRVRQYP